MNQRYEDERLYLRDKLLIFFYYRPTELIKNMFFEGYNYRITYKNYISVFYISILMVCFVLEIGIFGLLAGVLGCVFPMTAFYLVRYRIGLR